MARIRTIKPEFFRSRTLNEVSVSAQRTFVGLWCMADDEGRYRYEPALLRADVWPLAEDVTGKQVDDWVDELEQVGVVCRYERAGKTYLHVVNWHEHQSISRPSPSRLPECSRSTHGGFPEGSTPPARAQEVEREVEKELPTHPEDNGPPAVVHKASVENLSQSSQRRAKLRDPQPLSDALTPITGQKPTRPTRDQLKWREESDKRATADRLLRESGS